MNKQEIIVRLSADEDRCKYCNSSTVSGGDIYYSASHSYDMDCDGKDFELDYKIEEAISALEQQLTNGWILVSERLPEKYGLYIVSVYYSDWICDYGTDDEVHKEPENIVLMAEYRKGMNGGHKWYLHEEDGETTINGNEKVYDKPDYWSTYIKAWQPLPEPYKEVSDAERD